MLNDNAFVIILCYLIPYKSTFVSWPGSPHALHIAQNVEDIEDHHQQKVAGAEYQVMKADEIPRV